ncbi:microtubule-associated protein futsch [Lepisosteus oculatus]|uniref:microtubule-associated protein futsch n=1 Tax=Lepisosteus oculatus TaxID=7918 RepID=UPI003722B38C
MTEHLDRRFHNLTREQVETLDQVLTEVIPIHGRGNFPTLEVKPKDIIHVVKDRLVEKEITVRDVRLNGSTASHVLVKENGTSYKDLDIIFGVELPKQEDFQIIKEVVLGCLLDFLPKCVNKDKITALTMKEAYVQKMVKVFTEHDRWSLISLSNNSGKNVELKFVNSLRRQFEFSVDSFQIILDRMLESYQETERRQGSTAWSRGRALGDNASLTQGASQTAAACEEVLSSSKDSNEQSEGPAVPSMVSPTPPQDWLGLGNPSAGPSKDVPAQNEEQHHQAEGTSAETEGTPLSERKEPVVGTELQVEDSVLLTVREELEARLCKPQKDGEETPETDQNKLLTVVPEAEECVAQESDQEELGLTTPKVLPPQTHTSRTKDSQDMVVELPAPVQNHSSKELPSQAPRNGSQAPAKKSSAVPSQLPCPVKTFTEKESRGQSIKLPDLAEEPTSQEPESLREVPMTTAEQPPSEHPESQVNSSEAEAKERRADGAALPTPATNATVKDKNTLAAGRGTQSQSSQPTAPAPEVPLQGKDSKAGDQANEGQEMGERESFPVVLPEASEPARQAKDSTSKAGDLPSQVREARNSQGTSRELPEIMVVAESMYGDFEQAMDHLRYRLIATRNPEEIRGGGLLKYSNLLVRDFKPASETEIKTLERYMCSRFFIDFPDVNEQQRKIESYLRNHFIGEEKSKYDYLMTLRRVVNESTVCLMGHERRQTLNMITILALKVLGEQNIIPNTSNVTCFYQPAPYIADRNFSNYYVAHGQPPLVYHPYPLHIHMQTGLV